MEEYCDPRRRQYYSPHLPPVGERGHVPAYPPIARSVTMPEPQQANQLNVQAQQHVYPQFSSTATPNFPRPHHYGTPTYSMSPTIQAGNSSYSHEPVGAIPSHVSPTRSQTMWQSSMTGRVPPGRPTDRGEYYPRTASQTQPVLAGPSTWEPRFAGPVGAPSEEWHSSRLDHFTHEQSSQVPPYHQHHHTERSSTQPPRIGTLNTLLHHNIHSPSSSNFSNHHWGMSQGSQSADFVAEPEQYIEGETTPFPNLTRKALLIGIDYRNEPHYYLNGCIHDVERLAPFLNVEGNYPMENIVMLTENSQDRAKLPTRRNILHWINWLVEGAKEGDRLFFHFSGHGMQVPDKDGDEDDDHMDEAIIPLDFNFRRKKESIIDDELNRIMVRPLPRGCRLTAIIDACHSGSALDLQYTYDYSPEFGFHVLEGTRRQDRSSEGDVILLSGCMDSQKSMDSSWGRTSAGAMTDAFLNSMHSFKHRNQTFRELIADIRERIRAKHFDQIPQLSSSQELNLDDAFIF